MFKSILFFILGTGLLSAPSAAQAKEFTAPQPYKAERLYKRVKAACPSKTWECYEKELYALLHAYGPRGAIDTFKLLRNRGEIDIRVDPHHFVHHVGHHTAMAFGSSSQSFALCTPEFHAGCFHGFFQHTLGMGNPESEDEALGICSDLDKDPAALPETKFSCYHGLGHGFLMYKKYDLQAALKACDRLPPGGPQEGCWQGLFMENINGLNAGTAQKGVFSPKDPLAPCNAIAPKYQYQCYINHASRMMSMNHNDLQKAGQACLKAQGDMVKPCLASMGLAATNPSWQPVLLPGSDPTKTAANAWAICQKFPKDYITECVIPGVDNLMITNNLDVPTAQEFCMLTEEPLRSVCFKQIGVRLQYLTGDVKATRARCQSLKAEGQRACLAGAS